MTVALLGRTSAGALAAGGGSGFLAVSGPYTLAGGAPVTKLTGFLQGGASAVSLRGVIYADNGAGARARSSRCRDQVTLPAGAAAGLGRLLVRDHARACRPARTGWATGSGARVDGLLRQRRRTRGRYVAASYSASGEPAGDLRRRHAPRRSRSSLYATLGAGTPPPANTGLPLITGTPTQGQTLNTDNGTWTGSPSGFAYQWQDCDVGRDELH